MKLEWKKNQESNEDIGKVTIRIIEQPVYMSIYKYSGCVDRLFFDCKELGIDCVDLNTKELGKAEMNAIKVLYDRCEQLKAKVDTILSDCND